MPKKTYLMENTRRFKRLKADYLVKYQVPGVPDVPHVSNIKDIGAGGVQFWSEEILPEGALLQLSVLLPPLDRELKALGRVLRVRKAQHGNADYVALSFLELHKEDQKALDNFIEHLATTEDAPYLIDQPQLVRRSAEA